MAISSVQGRFAIPNRSAYSASKHALQAFCDSLRSELYDTNIKVCVVTPGYIRTNLSLNAVKSDGSNHGQMDAATAAGYSTDYVATQTIQAMLSGTGEIVIAGLMPKLLIYVRALFPNIFFKVMRKYAKNQK